MTDDMSDHEFAKKLAEVVAKHSVEADELAAKIGELCSGRPNLAVLLALTASRRYLELQADKPEYISMFFDAMHQYLTISDEPQHGVH
jgi:hypothetical protein